MLILPFISAYVKTYKQQKSSYFIHLFVNFLLYHLHSPVKVLRYTYLTIIS
jgi:hypothetical protein